MTEDANFAPPGLAGAQSALASWTRTIIRALRARGLDADALAVEAGIEMAGLDNPDARVAIAANRALWRRATHASGDPCFGLYVSRFATYTTFQALGAAVLASPTLREAFGRVVRYGRLIGDAAVAQLEDDRDCVRLVLDVAPGERPADEAIDALLALEVRVARLLSERRDLNPLRVELQRNEPSPSEPFRRFFRAPIVFRAQRNALEFAQRDFNASLPTGNAELSRWLDDALARSVARLDDQQIVRRIRAALLERLRDSASTHEAVARALGMSGRTLQRLLANAGTSYQALVAETRGALARAYLAEGWSVTEVALRLGFSSPSSFSRAFRRWTGGSPSAALRSARPAQKGSR